MITGFNHTSFTVANIDTAVRFWTAALGFEAASVSERSGSWQGRVTGIPGAKLKIAHLHGYGHHMEFIQYLEASSPAVDMQPNMPGVAHICLEVRDIAATMQRLTDLGATLQGEIDSVTNGPVTGMRACYIRDPSGIVIELLELPDSKENAA